MPILPREMGGRKHYGRTTNIGLTVSPWLQESTIDSYKAKGGQIAMILPCNCGSLEPSLHRRTSHHCARPAARPHLSASAYKAMEARPTPPVPLLVRPAIADASTACRLIG